MRRSGFTLIELMVTVTIGVVVFAGALMIYNFSNRSRGVTATARALQTALLIQEQLVTDMGRLVQAASEPLQVRDKTRLSFYTYDPTVSAGREMKVRGVVYSHEKKGKPLMRESGGAVESLGTAPLTEVQWSPFECATGPFLRVTLTVGREDGEPPGPDTVHSFLVPINITAGGAAISFPVETPFKDEKDEPEKQEFPDR